MILSEFLSKFDFPGSVILLGGKRKVAPKDQTQLTQLGKMLTLNSRHIIFRSGNAAGSDYLFSNGVAIAMADHKRLEVIMPFTNHRKKFLLSDITYSLSDIDLKKESAVINEAKKNIKTKTLVDLYLSENKNFINLKSAFIIRNAVAVLGTNSGIPPITAALFYDDYDNPRSGGTGFTMGVCDRAGTPFFTQNTWMPWLSDFSKAKEKL